MPYLFTSESVSEGHPDKVADQISDAVLDAILAQDSESKVACETFVTTGLVVVGGEIHSSAYINLDKLVRQVIDDIGYNRSEYQFDAKSCGIISTLHEQSSDIRQGVERESVESQGAGDQGMMFGYATNETENYMPLTLELSHMILEEMAALRKSGKVMKYLRPDSKSQVTLEYTDTHQPLRIVSIVVSTQHDDTIGDEKQMQTRIEKDLKKHLIPKVKKRLPKHLSAMLMDKNIQYLINPTGKFVIGGPHGDTGLTGRKIIVDTYGGKGAHGGGAFSGKDPSKVDRSAAYATRHIAKNLVAAGVADQILVQVAYAIGKAEPVGLYINTYGTAKVEMSDQEISAKVEKLFDLRPGLIIKRLGLKSPIFSPTAKYGHFGRQPGKIEVANSKGRKKKYETFTWEKLDYVKKIKTAFKLK
ncbi:S-adenosylmethionine synthase-like [Stigmatopora argus]